MGLMTKIVKEKIKSCLTIILSLLFVVSMLAAVPVTAEADEPAMIENIALVPGFYCLHPHKATPTIYHEVPMQAVSSKNYDGYSQDVLDRVAAAVMLTGVYKEETGNVIDEGILQSVIWSIVCDRPECILNGSSIHLNDNEETLRNVKRAYAKYIEDHYTGVVGKYTMTIWKSTDPTYQDILQAKMVEKFSVPSLEKKVRDRNDTESADFDSKGWQDSADYDIGDSIPFQITATLHNMNGFTSYYLKFDDTMTHMTYDPDSLEILIDGVDKTSGFDVTWDPSTKNLVIECSNILPLGAKTDSQVVVNYNATLDGDANIGHDGNPNRVRLVHSKSNKPGDTGTTPEDIVKVFTYNLTVHKIEEVDGENIPLAGAAFGLLKWFANDSAEGGEYISLGVIGAELDSNGNYIVTEDTSTSDFEWDGLDDGKYKLVEIVTPAGYNTIEPIEFSFTALHDHLSQDPLLYYLEADRNFDNSWDMSPIEASSLTEDDLYDLENGTYEIKYPGNYIYDGNAELSVLNNRGVTLPSTGGMGTKLIYIAGTILMLIAALLMLKKRVYNSF